jgi:4,5-DOPA dioxygenase extradiol
VQEPAPEGERAAERIPVGFVSHGTPMLALDDVKGRALRAWADSMPRPRALLVVSAHWEATPIALGAVAPEGLVYDFNGFDPRLREVEYGAPGSPALAERVGALLGGVARADGRMWDHGVWVPLVHMYPGADVPLLQLSLPSGMGTRELFDLGRKLRPLRDEGVFVLASGGMVHNLRAIDWTGEEGVPEWATSFETWAKEALVSRDVDGLLDLKRKAPDLRQAHPTLEHLLPLVLALGASSDADPVSFPVEGFELGSLSRTCVQFG